MHWLSHTYSDDLSHKVSISIDILTPKILQEGFGDLLGEHLQLSFCEFCNVVSFECVDENLKCDHSNKKLLSSIFLWYCLYIKLYREVLTFESVV